MDTKTMMTVVMLISALGCLPAAYSAQGGSNTARFNVTATVSGTNSLDLKVLNVADGQPVQKMQFLSTSGIVKAEQYLQIEFDTNALGAKIIIRTDNRNSTPPFTGSGEGAGLVGMTDSTKVVPLLWVVFPDSASAKSFLFLGDTSPDGVNKGTLPGASPRPAGEAEGIVVDKANPNFETPEVLNYVTVIVPNGTNALLGNFPTDEDGAGPKTGLRSAQSPVFMALGADFFDANSQGYATTALGLDLVVQ